MNGNARNEGFSSSGGKTDDDDFQFEFIALLHALLARPCVNYLRANTLRPQGKADHNFLFSSKCGDARTCYCSLTSDRLMF